MKSTIRKYTFLPGIALLILLVDRFSKRWIISNLQLGKPWNPVSFLRPLVSLTYVTNTGVAFGLFSSVGDLFAGAAILAVVGILAYYMRLSLGQWLVELSLGLMLGGALGNLLDRLAYGHVIDFIDFKVWPVFNFADSSIVIGMAILAWRLWRDQEQVV
ncbi:MAG: signal peptidase II [Chloroflexota bacterium]|nr:signal peptidase II [Chloroflexota bacterium]